MSRPAEKIAQLEAALEKKDGEVKLIQLTCRRLEEEIQQLRARVRIFFDAVDGCIHAKDVLPAIMGKQYILIQHKT